MTLSLRFAARSHVGMVREGNEDSVYAGPRVLAVADGMGGHAAGEVASAVAISAIARLDEDAPGADLLDALQTAAVAANSHLSDMVEGDGALDGMGTTLTAILFDETRLGLLHVGDSRCYLLRDGELTQITHDHTLVQTLVDDGRISEEEASVHPQRSLITRALDGRNAIEPDLSVREARPGDRYLLCTDGLTGPVSRLSTLRTALQIEDPVASCDRLVELALRGGGPDNITVIVADVVDADGRGASAPVVAGAAAEKPQPAPPMATDAGSSPGPDRGSVDDGPAGAGPTTATTTATTATATAVQERRAPDPSRADADRPTSADHNPDHDPEPEPARRRTAARRTAIGLGVVLVLVLGAAVGGWAYLRSQYYVGVADSAVAVYRGVNSELAGVELSAVDTRTELQRAQLDELDLARVERGIVAADREEAEQIVERLSAGATPLCEDSPEAAAEPSPSPSLEQIPGALPSPTAPAPSPSPTAEPADDCIAAES